MTQWLKVVFDSQHQCQVAHYHLCLLVSGIQHHLLVSAGTWHAHEYMLTHMYI